MRVALLNYGVGNLLSVINSLRKLGAEVMVVEEPSGIEFDGLILPGVGSFEAAAERLAGMRSAILELASSGTPILGICLGMQLFFERSEEGAGEGLGLFRGCVLRLRVKAKVPHMGWNTLKVVRESEILSGVESGEWVYFVHSYYPSPTDGNIVLAETNYQIDFPVIVGKGNVYGTQFHPEKSGQTGRKILINWLRMLRK